jgi:hypothetical protein
LRHEAILAQLTYSIGAFPVVAHVAVPRSSRGSALCQLPGVSDTPGISLEKIGAWRLSGQPTAHCAQDQRSRGDTLFDACSRVIFEPKLRFTDAQSPSVREPARAEVRWRAEGSSTTRGGAGRGSCAAP